MASEQKVEPSINHYIFGDGVKMTASCNSIMGRALQDCNHFNILQKKEKRKKIKSLLSLQWIWFLF